MFLKVQTDVTLKLIGKLTVCDRQYMHYNNKYVNICVLYVLWVAFIVRCQSLKVGRKERNYKEHKTGKYYYCCC